jgi:hypothetical protein
MGALPFCFVFLLAVRARSGTLIGVNSAPLGIFDSGVGGLTVVRAVQELLPAENILYLGDTARLPYGSKSPATIRQFADEDVRFLISHGVKAVVVACNTATAHALPILLSHYRVPILGVIEPGVEDALADPKAARIGIINPFFPALRSGHRLFQQPSPGKQFLSSSEFHVIIHCNSAPDLTSMLDKQ